MAPEILKIGKSSRAVQKLLVTSQSCKEVMTTTERYQHLKHVETDVQLHARGLLCVQYVVTTLVSLLAESSFYTLLEVARFKASGWKNMLQDVMSHEQ